MKPTTAHDPIARLAAVACLAVMLAGCEAGAPATQVPTPAGTPMATQSTAAPATSVPSATDTPVVGPVGLPPIGDIPYYKVDASRSGVHPGPGPMVEPVEAWNVQLGCSAGGAGTGVTGVIGSGLLVVGCDAPRVFAIDVATGSLRWTDEIDGTVEDLAIGDDTVYVGDMGGGLTAFDLTSGDVKWHIKRDSGGQTRAWGAIVSDGVVYLGNHDGRYVGYDATDGSEKWSWSAAAGVGSIGGTVLDGIAYVSGNDGYQRAIRIADGTEEWSFRTLSDKVSSVSITDDAVFVAAQGAGIMYGLDRATGDEIWRYQSPMGDQVAPPVNADAVVYSAAMPDGLVALDARDGTLLWRATTGSISGQAPAIAGDVIYQDTQRGVGAYSRTDGSQLWNIDLGATHDNSALVTGGMVITTDDHGYVRAFVDPALLDNFPTPAPSSATTPTPPAATALPSLLTLTATFDADSSDLAHVTDISAGPDGGIYVVNTETSEILVLDPASGAVTRRWGEPGSDAGQFNFILNSDPDNFDATGGVAVSSDGAVYVADTYNRRIQQFDAQGAFVRQWGRFGSDTGQFLEPADIAVGPDGSVYVLDPSRSDIQRFTAEGELMATIGEFGTGDGQISNGLGGIGVGADGALHYTDFDNNRLEAWSPDGSFDWVIAGDGSNADLIWPSDVAVDEGGRMYVSEGPGDPPLRRITTYDRDRNVIGSSIVPGPTFRLAYADGSLYVACFFTPQIFKLQVSSE
jgi:outer membrane protein assembly factor BamB